MQFKTIYLFLFLFINPVCLADAMPKGYQSYKFNTKIQIDSIQLLESDFEDFSKYETMKSHWQYEYISCNNNQCHFVGNNHKKYQRLIMFSSGSRFYTQPYKVEGSNPEFIVNEKNGVYVITETTNFFFRGIIGKILRALIITLILELFVVCFIIRKLNKQIILPIILVNCISLPTAWILFDLFAAHINSPFYLMICLEIGIATFEYFVLRYFFRDKIAPEITMYFSIVANLISFIIGGSVYLFTTFI